MDFLYQFFGWVLFVIYGLVKNYGVAIIIFTVLVKTAILPLNIKQTNSMRETQAILPEVQELQKKYKNNPEKLLNSYSNLSQQLFIFGKHRHISTDFFSILPCHFHLSIC